MPCLLFLRSDKMGATTFYLLEQEMKEREKNKKAKENKNIDYEDMTVKELRKIAKEKGINGYYNMKKDELIEALKG